MTNQGVWDQHATWREALNKTGKKMWLSICPQYVYEDAFPDEHCVQGFAYNTRGWVAMGLDPRELANGILVECESRSADLLRSVFFILTLSPIRRLQQQPKIWYDRASRRYAFDDRLAAAADVRQLDSSRQLFRRKSTMTVMHAHEPGLTMQLHL
jgi:hypothetical protein